MTTAQQLGSRRGTRSHAGFLERYFKISQRGSSLTREVRGGLVTFFTMAYIVVLNPIIIGTQTDAAGRYLGGGAEPNLPLVAASTALIAGVMTIAMGIVANYPLALATGLGLNAFVAFGVAKLPGMTWADAMGLVVIEGAVILLLVLSGFRQAVFHAVPAQLKTAISVGIGLFIALIGLVDAGFVRKAVAGPALELGVGGFLVGWPTLVFVIGLFAMIALHVRRVPGAILAGILGATVLAIVVESLAKLGPRTYAKDGSVINPSAWGLNVPVIPSSVVRAPDFSLLGDFNLLGSFGAIGVVSCCLLVFSLMLADFFDTMGTMVAIGAEGGLLDDEGNPPNIERILVVDSIAAIAGGVGSVSSNTSYIESAAGVGEGARTGLASVVTGSMFLLATFLAPLVEVVPYEAATPALILVGFLMMQQVAGIDWHDLEIAIPAFLTMVLMPFTYSISVGIGAGFVSFVLIKVVKWKATAVHPLMWVASALFVVYFAIDPLKGLIGA